MTTTGPVSSFAGIGFILMAPEKNSETAESKYADERKIIPGTGQSAVFAQKNY
jgi:hypothetical protein